MNPLSIKYSTRQSMVHSTGIVEEHSIGFSLRLPMGYSDGIIDRGYSVS